MINIYVIQILLILFFGFLFRNDKKKFLIAAFIILFVVMAFRNARIVGNDSATSYYYEFSRIQTTNLFSWSWPNPGLPFVMRVIRLFTDNYQWVIVITAVWVCFAYYKLLVQYSENGFISVMWFMGMLFYTFLFSALKQAWAMAFLCFAFNAIMRKKPIRFLALVGLATLFHFPALVFLPAYWIAKLKVNRAFPILMLSVLVVVFIFRTNILRLMTSAYSKGEGNFSADTRFIGTKFVFMILMLAYGFYQYFKHRNDTDQGAHLLSAIMYFMGIAAIIQTFCFYNNTFERLADFYYQFSILFVPLILIRDVSGSVFANDSESNQVNNTLGSSVSVTRKGIANYSINDIDISTVLAVVITVFCVWRFISFTASGMDSLTPYYFFWQ